MRHTAPRVDVVAWSYGGVITRWYLASRGQGPGVPAANSVTWYHLNNLTPSVPTNYQEDQSIRKVITLGSMWRGVPLCNFANEARLTGAGGISLGQAPIDFLGYGTLGNLMTTGTIDLANKLGMHLDKASIEVMAVNSPWMSYLVYGDPVQKPGKTAKPFLDEVAYGSVAGDNND